MTSGTRKGAIASALIHIIVCALMGEAAVTIHLMEKQEAVYDVALMSSSGAPAPAASPLPAEEPAVQEETPLPLSRLDDMLEERQRETPKPEQRITQTAPRSAPVGASPGGAGESASESEGSGSAGNEGIPPASDGIEAPVVPPGVLTSRMPDYPSSARSKGVEGVAIVRFLLDKEGYVDTAEIVESSGSEALDGAALKAAEGFRFKPGLDGYGRAVRCYVYIPFAFRLR